MALSEKLEALYQELPQVQTYLDYLDVEEQLVRQRIADMLEVDSNQITEKVFKAFLGGKIRHKKDVHHYNK